MNSRGSRSDATRVVHEAAAWLTRLENGEPRDWEAFAAWVQQSPQHVRTFLLTKALDQEMARIYARSRHEPQRASPVRNRSRGWAATAAVTAALVLVIAGKALVTHRSTSQASAEYTTPIGGQSTVAFAHGSLLHLNTQTRLRVSPVAERREVELVEGELLFEAGAKDHASFRVRSDEVLIEHTGADFAVDRRPAGTRVTVFRGEIQLARRAGITPVRLVGGQEIVLWSDARVHTLDAASLERRRSWRYGILKLEGTPLYEAIAEFNRYNRTRLVIDNPAIATIPLGGAFRTTEPEKFAEALGVLSGVRSKRITENGSGTAVIHLR